MRALDWFVPASQRRDAGLGRRIHVYVVAHFAGLPLALALVYALLKAVPSSGFAMAWLAPIYVALCALPFGLKLVPRLEVMGAVSAQAFTFAVLASAYFIGGFRSPALFWLIPAFATSVYYLAPRPAWRLANIALQIGQVAGFLALNRWVLPIRAQPSGDALILLVMASGFAVVALNSIVVAFLWSSVRFNLQMMAGLLATSDATMAALRESHDNLARAQRVGRTGSAVTDLATGKAEWSDELYRMFELDPAAGGASFERYLSCLHPDDRAPTIERRKKYPQGVEGGPIEVRIVRPSGEIRWLRRVGEIECDASGKPVRSFGTWVDITDIRTLDSELEESRRFLRQATESAMVGLLSLDHTTGEIYWSRELRQIYGLNDTEPITRKMVFDFAHPEDHAAIASSFEQIKDPTTGGRFDNLRRIQCRDGTWRWLITRGQTTFEGTGANIRPVRTVGAVMDVTKAKELEEQLRISRDELARAQKVAKIGSAVVNLVTGKSFWSDELYRIFELDPPTAGGSFELFLSRVHPEDRPKLVDRRRPRSTRRGVRSRRTTASSCPRATYGGRGA